jgi:choline dehydrogenase
VFGITRLRVVDASIFPDIPSVATNLTTIMLAERISAHLAG